MLSGLFKPDWQNDSAEKRLKAVAALNPDEVTDHSVLEELALNDFEFSVRKAALLKISKPEVILNIRQTHTDDETRTAADHVFLELIGPKSTLSEIEIRKLISENPELSIKIAKNCPFASLRTEYLQELPEAEIVNIIAEIEFSDTRSMLADHILTEKELERARKFLKGKDKNAEKIIKSKLDAIHAWQKQEQENLETVEQLCKNMEFLAEHNEEWRPDFNDRFALYSQQWKALEFKPQEVLQVRFNQASAIVKNIVEQRSSIENSVKQQDKLTQEVSNLCCDIAPLTMQQFIIETSILQNKVKQYTNEWEKHSELVSPESKLENKFVEARQAMESSIEFAEHAVKAPALEELISESDIKETIKLVDSALSNLRWPQHYPNLQIKAEALELLEELRKQSKDVKDQAKTKLDKLHKRINRLFGNAKRGELPRAKRELAALIKLSGHYSGKDKTALDERLEEATIAVDKMADWKDFATEPKYLELCDEMEALIKSKSHPDKLATEINKLQKRWKALGHSESADEHWERFKSAGDKAYAPCEEFFNKRHALRKQNLDKRKVFVLKIKELLDTTEWEKLENDSPEYKKIETKLRYLTKDFQKIKDVEQGPGQKQWKNLTKIKSAIYDKLDVVFATNLALRNELITQAEELLELEVKDDTFSKLQRIQGSWKEIGITRRKDDQKAWKKFKKATDNVYEKIQGIRKAKRAEEDEHLNGYRNIIRGINKLAKSSKDLADADSNFERLQKDYQELPPLPRGLPEKLVEGIAKDYKRACTELNKARERIIQKNKSRALDNLAEKATLCSKLEAIAVNGSEEDKTELRQKLDSIEITDNELRKRFDKRLASVADTDRSQATEVRKLMCIDLEILLGVDSPAEDKAQRMKIQLERMQQGGFGQGHGEKAALLKQLKLDWYCLPGAEPDIQEKLDVRFLKLINK
jgi:hypothetical protein